MDVDRKCNNDTSLPMCYESSGLFAVIIIPSLLALATVFVVSLIFCSLCKNKRRGQSTSAHFSNDQTSVSPPADPVNTEKVQQALAPWEITKECVLGGLEFWQMGRYGPICKGLLKMRDGATTPVVVKSLRDGPQRPEAKEFVERVLFHATVCRHENVVQMLCCQTRRLPMYLVLESCSPGNLLHFLWTLRNTNSDIGNTVSFCERSVFQMAKQVAAGLDYLMSEHRLVHGDVAARNILIGSGLSARVSGLGVAFSGRNVDSAIRQRAAEVPLKWQAPERIMMQLSIDRSDVWSFGILLYELVTLGSPPYPEVEPAFVLPKLQRSYRMNRPETCGGSLLVDFLHKQTYTAFVTWIDIQHRHWVQCEKLNLCRWYDLMKYCWMWSFKDRPAFSAIINLLESSLHLAATKPICVTEAIDILEYNRKAGLTPRACASKPDDPSTRIR